jgi:N-acetylglucosamine kinase-like BadF-type ATPase
VYLLGVDGGGTKTAAVLFDTDRGIVRSLSLAGGNICVVGQSGCEKLLQEIISRLLAGIALSELAYATFGFAGAGRPAERTVVESAAGKSGFKTFCVKTDAQILHYSFFGDTQGIMIASGTGSVCLVNTPDGQYRQIGGWGYILGDGGSGFHIGKLAIAHALHNHETGRKQTRLTQALLKFYQVHSPAELVTLTYSSASSQRFVASCSCLVDKLANDNDPDALEVMDCAGLALVELAQTAMNVCANPESGKYNIALAGSVLSAGSVLERRFKRIMGIESKSIQYFTQQCTPAAAAVLYSASQCGCHLSQLHRQTLSNVTFIGSDSSMNEYKQ